jgi:hypothetical protein
MPVHGAGVGVGVGAGVAVGVGVAVAVGVGKGLGVGLTGVAEVPLSEPAPVGPLQPVEKSTAKITTEIF